MKHNISRLAFCSAAALAMTACELDEYNPMAGTGGDVLATQIGLDGLALYCYEPLYDQLYSAFDYLSVAEGGTDIFFTSGANPDYAKELFFYDGLATNTNASNKVFKQAYAMINSCNGVVEQAGKVVDGDAKVIDDLVAQAKCLRAFYYSILVTNYGNVPLILTNSGADVNYTPERSTYEALYAQMVKDLKEAAEVLDVKPYKDQYSRVTKKTALGLLARVYAQGAGDHDLKENGVSYWQRAKEVAEDLIDNMDAYGAFMYDDVDDLWAQANNRNNKEALFIAAGPDGLGVKPAAYNCSNLFNYLGPDPNACFSDVYKTSKKQNYHYGRMDNVVMGPTKYMMDLFDADNDKRFENTFLMSFSEGTYAQTPEWGGSYLAKGKFFVWDSALCVKYHKDLSLVGDTIYPYGDFKWVAGAWNQYPSKVWPKGGAHDGDIDKLMDVKNIYVMPPKLEEGEDRVLIFISKEDLTDEQKSKALPVVYNLSELFDANGSYYSASFDGTNSFKLFPMFIKYNWNYLGAFGDNINKKSGDMMIMRMAEVYLIAAEAEQKLGNGAKATEYINVLRERACRDKANLDAFRLQTAATEQDILDEYARELCGEFTRWALLKRHHAFETQLPKGNKRAAGNFDPSKHYLRPISYDFLSQIDNSDEFGTNGY